MKELLQILENFMLLIYLEENLHLLQEAAASRFFSQFWSNI